MENHVNMPYSTVEPEVKAESPAVHAGVGYQVELVCVVYSEPAADVLWYKVRHCKGYSEDNLTLRTKECPSYPLCQKGHPLFGVDIASPFLFYPLVEGISLGTSLTRTEHLSCRTNLDGKCPTRPSQPFPSLPT